MCGGTLGYASKALVRTARFDANDTLLETPTQSPPTHGAFSGSAWRRSLVDAAAGNRGWMPITGEVAGGIALP